MTEDTDTQYFYADGEDAIGPHSLTKLQQMAASGIIAPEVYVAHGGSEDWIPLSELIALNSSTENLSGGTIPAQPPPLKSDEGEAYKRYPGFWGMFTRWPQALIFAMAFLIFDWLVPVENLGATPQEWALYGVATMLQLGLSMLACVLLKALNDARKLSPVSGVKGMSVATLRVLLMLAALFHVVSAASYGYRSLSSLNDTGNASDSIVTSHNETWPSGEVIPTEFLITESGDWTKSNHSLFPENEKYWTAKDPDFLDDCTVFIPNPGEYPDEANDLKTPWLLMAFCRIQVSYGDVQLNVRFTGIDEFLNKHIGVNYHNKYYWIDKESADISKLEQLYLERINDPTYYVFTLSGPNDGTVYDYRPPAHTPEMSVKELIAFTSGPLAKAFEWRDTTIRGRESGNVSKDFFSYDMDQYPWGRYEAHPDRHNLTLGWGQIVENRRSSGAAWEGELRLLLRERVWQNLGRTLNNISWCRDAIKANLGKVIDEAQNELLASKEEHSAQMEAKRKKEESEEAQRELFR